ncbi:C1 family peptidase [Bacillus thuringiensis]|uniref:C1 family peptidase n=1 Tax=Bacillus thuringiensis TaxID=1428 RepID=UPI0034576434
MKRKYPLKQEKIDLRDFVYYANQYKSASQLPATMDLRSQLSPVVDQGQLGSCTANAIVSGLAEYMMLKQKRSLIRLSRLFLYWEERYLEGTVNEDNGAYIRDGMKVLQQIGTCPEVEYPYNIAHFRDTPTPRQVTDAAAYRMISQYYRVNNVLTLKTAIAEGLPVVVGFLVYESFESEDVAQTGIVPIPNTNQESLLGGHAVLAVGYIQIEGENYIIIRNSWGTDWGDEGYCYMPESFFTLGFVTDMWTGQ